METRNSPAAFDDPEIVSDPLREDAREDWLERTPGWASFKPTTRRLLVDLFAHVDSLPSDEAATVWETVDLLING